MDPFVHRIQPLRMGKVRLALQQRGVSAMGANQFLEGRPVGFEADRLLLAQMLVDAIEGSPRKPAEFKPAEFKPAEFKPAEFKPVANRIVGR